MTHHVAVPTTAFPVALVLLVETFWMASLRMPACPSGVVICAVAAMAIGIACAVPALGRAATAILATVALAQWMPLLAARAESFG